MWSMSFLGFLTALFRNALLLSILGTPNPLRPERP